MQDLGPQGQTMVLPLQRQIVHPGHRQHWWSGGRLPHHPPHSLQSQKTLDCLGWNIKFWRGKWCAALLWCLWWRKNINNSILLCPVLPRYFLALYSTRYYNSTFRPAAPEAGTFLFSGFYTSSRSKEERDEKDIIKKTTTTIIQTVKPLQSTPATIKFRPGKTDISSMKRATAAVLSLTLRRADQIFPSLTKLFRVKMSLIAPVLPLLFKVERKSPLMTRNFINC